MNLSSLALKNTYSTYLNFRKGSFLLLLIILGVTEINVDKLIIPWSDDATDDGDDGDGSKMINTQHA